MTLKSFAACSEVTGSGPMSVRPTEERTLELCSYIDLRTSTAKVAMLVFNILTTFPSNSLLEKDGIKNKECFKMNQLKVFENDLFKVSAKLDNDQVSFDIEEVAKSLGFVQTKNQKHYIRWETINRYLEKYLSQRLGKGDFIPEPLVYKLAFKASNELAEKFQDWLAIEVIPSIRKTGTYQMEKPQTHLEVLQGAINQMVEQDKKLQHLEGQVNNISNIVSMSNVGWREKVKVVLRKVAKNWSGVEPYRSVINLSYERFEQRAGCKLDLRLNNRKERALSQGMSKSYVQKINKLDVISEEKRLVEIYIQVVKEMAIQFRVDINDFEEVI